MRICKHCGVRIEQQQVGSGLAWMHVNRWNAGGYEGVDTYRVCKLALVAEPHGGAA
jgi:hypothetical protein